MTECFVQVFRLLWISILFAGSVQPSAGAAGEIRRDPQRELWEVVYHFPYATDRARKAIASGADVSLAAATGETLLMEAIRSLHYGPHEDLVALLLDAGAEVNTQDDHGMSPMAYALLQDGTDRELVRSLIDHGWEPRSDAERIAVELVFADIDGIERLLKNSLDPKIPVFMGATPLMIVARHNPDLEVVKRLVKAGGDVDIERNWPNPRLRTLYPETPPLIALRSNPNPEVISFLFEASQDPQAPLRQDRRSESLLMVAASTNPSIEVLQWLIEQGEDPTHRDDSGWNVIIHALSNHDPDIIEFLVKAGAESHGGEWPSLYGAVRVCDAPMIEKLLELGAANHPSLNWDEVIHNYAVSGWDPAILDVLLKHGADLSARSEDGQTVLIASMSNRHLPVVRKVIEVCANSKVEMNATDELGFSALHWAANRAHLLGPQLVEAGCDLNANGNEGETSLMMACSGYYNAGFGDLVASVQWMLEHGADPLARATDGATALTFAVCGTCNDEVIRLLLNTGLDINDKIDGGYTALHCAMRDWKFHRLRASSVAMLIELGADPNTVSDDGSTSLHDAILHAEPEHVLALLDGGADAKVRNAEGLLPITMARRFMDDERVLIRLEEAMK